MQHGFHFLFGQSRRVEFDVNPIQGRRHRDPSHAIAAMHVGNCFGVVIGQRPRQIVGKLYFRQSNTSISFALGARSSSGSAAAMLASHAKPKPGSRGVHSHRAATAGNAATQARLGTPKAQSAATPASDCNRRIRGRVRTESGKSSEWRGSGQADGLSRNPFSRIAVRPLVRKPSAQEDPGE